MRKPGQGGDADHEIRDLRAELLQAEAAHFAKVKGGPAPPQIEEKTEERGERQFFAKALQENIRFDGRAFDQYRPLELEFGDELGVVDVRLGKTRYVSIV